MRGFTGYFVVVGLAFAPLLQARAQAAPLGVERDPGAEDCPDAATLAAKVRAIRGSDPSGSARYAVRFAHDAGEYSSQIQSGQQSTDVRRIEDRGPDCAALAQATAVTLALLYDAAATHTPEALAPVVEHKPAPAVAVPEARAPARALQASLSLGGGALFGIVRPVAPLFLAQGGVVLPRMRFALGALFVPTQRLELAPGYVSASLRSGDARACYAALRGASLRFDLCSGFMLGVTSAGAHGFTRNERHSRVFTALPLELALAQFGRALGWELGAALLIPFRRAQFAVDGAGTAYASPPVGALLTLRAVGLWPW